MRSPQSRQAVRAAAYARRLEIATLRRQGVTSQQQIAERLGVSKSTVSADFTVINQWWREQAGIDVDAEIRLELIRLDGLLEEVWPKAMEGKLQAVDRVLAIMDRRAKLLGLEAPKRAVIETSGVVRQYVGIDPASFDFDSLDEGDSPSRDKFELETLLAHQTVPDSLI